jgi:hypothetical protein
VDCPPRSRVWPRARNNYYELRYEDLIEKPHETLRALAEFSGQELDYAKIQQAGIGSVSQPNTSFSADSPGAFNPIGRWEKKMTPEQVADFEALTGDFLRELGYPLSSATRHNLRTTRLRYTYLAGFTVRHWLKSKTPLGRFAKLERLEITDTNGM